MLLVYGVIEMMQTATQHTDPVASSSNSEHSPMDYLLFECSLQLAFTAACKLFLL